MDENTTETEFTTVESPKRAFVKKALIIGGAAAAALAAGAVVVNKIRSRENEFDFGYADGDISLTAESTDTED